MRGKGHYEYPAWCQMENALCEYEEDRSAYLAEQAKALGPEGQRQLGLWNNAADALVEGVQDLAGVDVVESLRGVLSVREGKPAPPTPLELMDEHVCVCFAWESMKMLGAARGRFWRLLGCVKNREPSPHAKAFLGRVARCYLFGFDAECIVMCRAVLDREFAAEIDDADVVAWLEKAENECECESLKPSLSDRIQAAFCSGRIDDDCKAAADKVREDGNDAVHKRPSKVDALPYIQKTVQVLDALDASK